MAQVGEDCYFFYYSSCTKGTACPFRHVEEARANEVTCTEWQLGRCRTVSCPFRHMELQKNRTQTPCYYETQPGGCSKQLCPFMHKFPRTTAIPTSVVSRPQPMSGQSSVHPQNTWVPPPGMPPRNRAPPPHTMWSAPVRPHTAGTMFPPRGAPVPPFPHYLPRPPQEVPYTLDQSGDVNMLQVDPVIISLNSEESDQESQKSASPVKAVSRTVVPTGTAAAASNPLDYFLNAKRWVDPNPQRQDPLRQYDSNPSRLYSRRSPSPPPRHSSPYRRRNSMSPETRSPRGSPVPDGLSRRRSVSVERTDREPARRRSHSLDRSRSQSPDWRDRRRFGRRSRSPQRHRSRSPVRGRLDGRGRGRDLRNRLPMKRAPVLEEVKVTGSKIVSTKKDVKKEEDGEKKEVDEKPKEPEKVPFVEEEVKSLEEIYRERALLSMMEAKKKKIIENKRKRWESVKGEQKKSESDKSESEKQTADEKTKGDDDTEEEKTEKEEDSSNDSAAESDIDLADDVDVEIDAGELDSAGEQSDNRSGSESEGEEAEDRRSSIKSGSSGDEEVDVKSRPTRSTVSKIVHQAKPSIKSRLGLKAVEPVTKNFAKGRLGNNTSQIRSVKERLGLKTSDTDRPVRSGIIKLSRPGVDRHEEKSISRMRMNRDMRGVGRSESHKAILVVPQITIKNKIEERKAGIKKRLGLIDDNDRRKRKEGLDEELIKLLKEEDVDLDLSEMDLLTKKEKKKLLKKLLAQQGREDEYDIITGKKRKKRGLKKKRERADRDEDSEGERGISRRINIKSRLGPSPERDKESEESEKEEEKEKDTSHDLESGDEIELEAGDQSDEEKSSEKETEELVSQEDDIEVKEVTLPPADKVVVKAKSQEELRLARVAKAAKLKKALEPKTLDDIRRERAHKRSYPGGAGDTIRIAAGQKGRRIIVEEEAEPVRKDPAVTVTFGGRNPVMKRKLIRLGDAKPEQNENTKPEVAKTTKTFKRERTIYVPPSLKRIDGSVTVDAEALKKAARPPIGREIVDYGEMFPSKSASTGDLFGKKAQTKVATASTSAKETSVARPVEKSGTRLAMRLQKGPPKIEVKDATVKTFAEIMAEKKRKRLEAQQGSPSKKPYRPIVFEEDSNSTPASTSSQETKLVPDLRDRLSSFEGSTSVTTTFSTSSKSQPSSNPSSVTSSPVKMLNVTKKTTSVGIVASKCDTNKLNRWKRRKPNEISTRTTVSKSEDNIVSKSEEDILLQSDSYRDEFDRTDSKVSIKEEITHVSPVRKELPSSVVKKPTSPPAAMKEEESLPEPEKEKKMSDSFLDFGDDLLDMEGDDVDLDLDPDHDELMKEIDELLA